MVSKLARRSGVAVFALCEYLEWKPDTIIQVGVGFHSKEIEVISEEWPDVRLIGYEPNTRVFEGMKKKYPGVIYPYAISNWKGKAKLFNKRIHADGSSLHVPKQIEKYNEMEVDVRVLDSLHPPSDDLGSHVLLWLDCEGSEFDALKGGVNLLDRVDVINVELTTVPINTNWCNAKEVHNWLIDHGYKRQAAHTQRTSAGMCDAIYVKDHLFQLKHCCCPCSF